jgi:phosphohistidine swiveling domain-containing protein
LLTLVDSIEVLEAGHKARTLGRMARAGLPVPPGFVVLPSEAVLDHALEMALAALGGERFAVRSSSTVEDGSATSAAGVFESVIGVRGLVEVRTAIERVRASLHDEPAHAYLSARHIPAEAVRMAVLLQPEVKAPVLGVARSEPGGFLIEERPAGEPEWGDVLVRRLRLDDPSPLGEGLRRLEKLVGSALDVEFARAGGEVFFLQARPLVSPPPNPAISLPLAGHWRRDAEHNPDPLSFAQKSLVERMEALGVGPRQSVVNGYLYYERGKPRKEAIIPLEDLESRYRYEIAPDCEARLAAVEDATVEEAVSAYAHVYRRYAGEVSPSLRRARDAMAELLGMFEVAASGRGDLFGGTAGLTWQRDESLFRIGRATGPERTALLQSHLVRYGAYAPAWDVAVPPDDECPTRVEAMAARWAESDEPPAFRHARSARAAEQAAAQLFASLPPDERRVLDAKWRLLQGLLSLAEDDDMLFFRAQRAVRRALLRRGRMLVEKRRLENVEDVFELPLELDAASDLGRIVAAHRLQSRQAARLVPPISVHDGVGRWGLPRGRVLRGQATFGRAEGRAVLVRSLLDAPARLPSHAILVVPAILPSLTFLLPAAAALVTAHGGATSHGATLAREYGVPAVLGVGDTVLGIAEGRLFVDGQRGRVYVLEP